MDCDGDASRETTRDMKPPRSARSRIPRTPLTQWKRLRPQTAVTFTARAFAQGVSMSKLEDIAGRASDIASQLGGSLKHSMPDKALKWVETGAALGAMRTGTRVATRFVRRNPAVAVAAAAGAGLLWYAARRRAKRLEADAPIEGSAKRVEAKRGSRRKSS